MGRRVFLHQSKYAGHHRKNSSGDVISVMNDYVLVKDNPPIIFVGIDDLMEKVNVQGQSQYLTFSQVNADNYHSIYRYRDERRRKFLLTYFSPIETLIVKIPSCPTEPLHRNFGALLCPENGPWE